MRSVREPIGDVDCEDAAVEVEWLIERFDNCDAGVAGGVEVLVDKELEVDWEFEVEAVERVESRDWRLSCRFSSEAVAKVAILIPRLVLVLAGMKRVVRLLSAGMAMRWGWLVEQHPVVSWVPVEY